MYLRQVIGNTSNICALSRKIPTPWSRALRHGALNSYFTGCVIVSIPGEGGILRQCIGSLPTQHRQEFGLVVIYSCNTDLEGQQLTDSKYSPHVRPKLN